MSLNNLGLGFALDFQPPDPYRLLGSTGVMLRMHENIARIADQQRRMFAPALDMQRRIEETAGPTPNALSPMLDLHRQVVEGIVGPTFGTLNAALDVRSEIESIAGIGRFGPTIALTPITDQLDHISAVVDRLMGHFLLGERLLLGMQRGLCHKKLTAVNDGDIHTVQRFTVLIGLPADHWSAVAEILWEGRWFEADDPIAYVAGAARLAHRNAQRPCRSTFHRELRREALPDESEGRGLLDPRWEQPYRLVELHREYGIEGLTKDELVLAEARMHGVTRAEAPDVLGWTVRKVARVWKQLNRRRQGS